MIWPKDSKMEDWRNANANLSEKMMEWNTPVGIIETVINHKLTSWNEGRSIPHLPEFECLQFTTTQNGTLRPTNIAI